MQAAQETVSDPSNIIHSMRKRPIVHVCDDACTVAEYERIHYPEDTEICFGDRKGCFEKPVKGLKPTSGIDCKVNHLSASFYRWCTIFAQFSIFNEFLSVFLLV